MTIHITANPADTVGVAALAAATALETAMNGPHASDDQGIVILAALTAQLTAHVQGYAYQASILPQQNPSLLPLTQFANAFTSCNASLTATGQFPVVYAATVAAYNALVSAMNSAISAQSNSDIAANMTEQVASLTTAWNLVNSTPQGTVATIVVGDESTLSNLVNRAQNYSNYLSAGA